MTQIVESAYEVLTGNPLPDINGSPVRVAVAHTLKNARILLEAIEKGTSPYAFIEVMTCPGGCLGGGGQPIPTTAEIRKKRAESIYSEDAHKIIRKSHENPEIKYLYDHFLIEPLGDLSHHLLHTRYVERGM